MSDDQSTDVTEPDPAIEPVTVPDHNIEPVTVPDPAIEPVTEPAPTPPPASSPAVPTPAMFARRHGTPDRTAAYGRVADDGVVYVTTPDGERAVGSYPGASPAGALAYFGRKYDELVAAADLLHQRVTQTDISAKDAEEGLVRLREQTTKPNAVGDLAALEVRVAEIEAVVVTRRAADAASRAAAREEGRAHREALVTEAETIAAQPESSIQWKSSGTRMRELLDEWKAHQRSGPRLDRGGESALWQRFSAARNGFDRARRVHFAQLDTEQSSAKVAKERLVEEAERLSTSKDWAPTASAFKKLMDQWRTAGRAGRSDDDALWGRFKAAQDGFFAAKDAVVAKEEESFRGNLEVKERLLRETDGILPVKDLERAKASLRSIQDRWDKAGKVPRADLERTEKSLRRVEQAVRDSEDRRWSSANPEAAARAQSLADQLEIAVAGLRRDLAKAEASGDTRKIAQATEALEAREKWLAQAKAGLAEFG
ncbi:DUF349 domain-containing protein [Lapillicoccus sp.]|uniref:DUF349 domain-containing protein n=1 Tax=Lapillicoccus sp. TaxID=1909287 RepID=UPI0032666B63